MLIQKLMGGSEESKIFSDEVFSSFCYTGNSSTQTINNGIDLAGKGGLVWIKSRSYSSSNHNLFDTARTLGRALWSNSTNTGNAGGFQSFNSNGFTLYASDTDSNYNGYTYASWTFRKAPKFFDVVTYTGNGVAGRQIPHALGIAPGMVIVKRTDAVSSWEVWHTGAGNGYLWLNTTGALQTGYAGLHFGSGSGPSDLPITPTDSHFTVGSDGNVNTNGGTYVAYLFAHDPSADGIIQCGSFTAGATVNLGFEPQYLLVKCSSSTEEWRVFDTMRGLKSDVGGQALLVPNSNAAETTFNYPTINAQGFSFGGITSATYIYLAIRRPNKPPTSGTQVYNAKLSNAPGASSISGVGFAPDFLLHEIRNGSGSYRPASSRLTGSGNYLRTSETFQEVNLTTGLVSWDMDGVTVGSNAYWSAYDFVSYFFRRAQGFFDVVCYTGTGVARTVPHNLGVAPELMIVKYRDYPSSWNVWHAGFGNITDIAHLDTTAAKGSLPTIFNSTYPTASVFSAGTDITYSPYKYVAYLFASLPGVSKVGSYTGNGTSQTINCGFTTGARFFLVKATSTTGSWWVFDSARGIVSATDFGLQLNSTAAETTSADAVDPDASGIIVNQEATCSINASGVSYVFLAIA